MKDFCILGAGVAGSSIARLLSKKYSVEVFDKARGPGGRASNRKYIKNLSFDHGLQYISPINNKFSNTIKKLKNLGVLREWGGNHIDFTLKNRIKKIKYIGKKSNTDMCKYLLKNIKTNYLSNIKKISFNSQFWKIYLENKKIINFKYIILTCPYPQVKKIAGKYIKKKIEVKMEPNITLMVAYKKGVNLPISSIKFNDKMLGWAGNENSKKRFKSKLDLWTIQANLRWSRLFINKYKSQKNRVINLILKRFEELIGFKKKNAVIVKIHGWKYSYNFTSTNTKSYWSPKNNLGICGDWFLGPKAEHASISAHNLYSKIFNKKKPA